MRLVGTGWGQPVNPEFAEQNAADLTVRGAIHPDWQQPETAGQEAEGGRWTLVLSSLPPS